jgi:hypothetical protein
MITLRALAAVAFLLVATVAFGQKVITLTDDVSLEWSTSNDVRGRSGVCGFMITGNHNSHDDPKVEWDINVDEVWRGSERAAGYTAGTFDVLAGKRVARPPIVALSFAIDGLAETIATRIVGSPNADNGIRGQIDLERAQRLFDAFSAEKWITINLTLADQTVEILRTRGYHEPFHGGRSSPFNRCLAGGAAPHGLPWPPK